MKQAGQVADKDMKRENRVDNLRADKLRVTLRVVTLKLQRLYIPFPRAAHLFFFFESMS